MHPKLVEPCRYAFDLGPDRAIRVAEGRPVGVGQVAVQAVAVLDVPSGSRRTIGVPCDSIPKSAGELNSLLRCPRPAVHLRQNW